MRQGNRVRLTVRRVTPQYEVRPVRALDASNRAVWTPSGRRHALQSWTARLGLWPGQVPYGSEADMRQ
jgi:hypothetical protein